MTSRRVIEMHPSKPSLVLFHKQGCPYCTNFMPLWQEIAKQLDGKVLIQQFARNDQDVDDFMQFHKIKTFPSIQVYHPNSGNVRKFSDARTVDNVVQFALEPHDSVPKPKVLFLRMERCGACVRVKPTWDQVVEHFRNDHSVTLTDYEYMAHPNVMSQFGVHAFPTFLRIDSHGNLVPYDGDRSFESMVRFVKGTDEASETEEEVPLKGFTKLKKGNKYKAFKADDEHKAICMTEGTFGGQPKQFCKPFKGRGTAQAAVSRKVKLLQNQGWEKY